MARSRADLLAFAPRQALGLSTAPMRAEAQPQLQESLLKAVALQPANPDLRELLALWYERAVQRLPPTHEVALGYHQQALVHWRASVSARPGAPYAWAAIALSKHRTGVMDEEFRTALANAARLGPWEPDIQLTLAGLYFATRGRLPEDVKAPVVQAITNALRRDDKRLFELAMRLGALDVICLVRGIGVSPLARLCT